MEEKTSKENRGVFVRTIENEMKTSFIDYSMSVIMSRALPDIRDGLKPVHRRILYAMNEMGLSHDKPFKKSARVVGEVLGKYHPHGDQAVYDTLVRMAQDFSLRYPLVEGQGNFGSIDGDSPAAMRYTEVRMAKITKLMLEDIDKDTVNWKDNFDGTLKEPEVLPAKLPNLLINGSSGIAVGMATNMAPHNIDEIVDGIRAVIENPEITTAELMEIIKGPDFPTGGIIYGREGIKNAYENGRGLIRIRARTSIEGEERKRIVVTEIPYQVNKSDLLKNIAELVKNKKIEGISDLRDESDRNGLRIVIVLKRDTIEDAVLNQLFEHTQLQSTFGILNLAIVNEEPKVLTLKGMIEQYIDYRIEVITRRAEYELRRAKERLHILDGLLIALRNIDRVIEIIKKSKDVERAKNSLMEEFSLSEIQTKAILDMKLQKLTGLERESIEREHKEIKERIEKLTNLLDSKENILNEIEKELADMKERFGDERRTGIVESEADLNIEDLIPKRDVIITITGQSYIKRMDTDLYKTQRRGGKGLIGMETKEEDIVVSSFVTSTHDYIMFFTNHGKVYWLKGYQIPEGGRHARGKAIINLIPKLEEGEKVEAAIPVHEFDNEYFLVFATKSGLVKKTVLSAYKNIRSNGIMAINIDKDDELIDVKISNGGQYIFISTEGGKACWFNEREVRPTGRVTRGVRAVRLKKGDRVVSMDITEDYGNILVITENGYGKRTDIKEYRKTHRGSKGVKNIITNERNGMVVYAQIVNDEDEIMVVSEQGMAVRIMVKDIRKQGRNTMGVRIMKLNKGDRIVSVAKIESKQSFEE